MKYIYVLIKIGLHAIQIDDLLENDLAPGISHIGYFISWHIFQFTLEVKLKFKHPAYSWKISYR